VRSRISRPLRTRLSLSRAPTHSHRPIPAGCLECPDRRHPTRRCSLEFDVHAEVEIRLAQIRRSADSTWPDPARPDPAQARSGSARSDLPDPTWARFRLGQIRLGQIPHGPDPPGPDPGSARSGSATRRLGGDFSRGHKARTRRYRRFRSTDVMPYRIAHNVTLRLDRPSPVDEARRTRWMLSNNPLAHIVDSRRSCVRLLTGTAKRGGLQALRNANAGPCAVAGRRNASRLSLVTLMDSPLNGSRSMVCPRLIRST